MSPEADDDHQEIVMEFCYALRDARPRLGKVRPGVNLASSADDWMHNYRVPDVLVFLAGTEAVNHGEFWTGAADFIIEVTSPRDRSYEKIPFYSQIGVREMLILNRQKWVLELFWHDGAELHKIADSTIEQPETLPSSVLPLTFRLIPGDARPQVEVTHKTSGERWVV